MNKTVGVLGGMGPQATIDYFQKVINLINANSDQEHLHLIIDNNPQIPDRSSFIAGTGESPLKELISSALKLQLMGADFLVMPCNTAHYFYSAIKEVLRIPFINMVEEVTASASQKYGPGAAIGLLATPGTYAGNMYAKAFSKHRLQLIEPNESEQAIIWDYIRKIKRGNLDSGFEAVSTIILHMMEQGADAVILGCTELSLATSRLPKDIEYIDTTSILAERTTAYARSIPFPESQGSGRCPGSQGASRHPSGGA